MNADDIRKVAFELRYLADGLTKRFPQHGLRDLNQIAAEIEHHVRMLLLLADRVATIERG